MHQSIGPREFRLESFVRFSMPWRHMRRSLGQKGLAYICCQGDELKSPNSKKYLSQTEIVRLKDQLQLKGR